MVAMILLPHLFTFVSLSRKAYYLVSIERIITGLPPFILSKESRRFSTFLSHKISCDSIPNYRNQPCMFSLSEHFSISPWKTSQSLSTTRSVLKSRFHSECNLVSKNDCTEPPQLQTTRPKVAAGRPFLLRLWLLPKTQCTLAVLVAFFDSQHSTRWTVAPLPPRVL